MLSAGYSNPHRNHAPDHKQLSAGVRRQGTENQADQRRSAQAAAEKADEKSEEHERSKDHQSQQRELDREAILFVEGRAWWRHAEVYRLRRPDPRSLRFPCALGGDLGFDPVGTRTPVAVEPAL